MQEYFEHELGMLEKEMRWLKTSNVKSGAAISSMVRKVSYSIALRLASSTNATGSVLYRARVSSEAILNATLDKYYDDIAVGPGGDTRRRAVEMYCIESGEYIIRVSAWGDSNDIVTLTGGGSVTMSGTLAITCTDDFSLEVES